MKAVVLIVFSIISFSLLSSCRSFDGGCGEPTGCWKRYFIKSSCGTYVTSPCEHLCDKCTFNEPECQICWSCVSRDGCGYPQVRLEPPCSCTRIRQ
jgi:hypothetical protein